MSTPPIITRIASSTTTAQDAEKVLAVVNAAQNMHASALSKRRVAIPVSDIANLLDALAALDEDK